MPMDVNVDVAVSNALDELSNVLSSIAESPYSLGLHAKHISLTNSPDLSDQFESAVELLTSFLAAPSQVWLTYLQSKLSKLGLPEDFENYEEPVVIDLKDVDSSSLDDLFECFRKATSDYLSIPILKKQIGLLISLHASASSNSKLQSLLSEESTRSAINAAVSQGLGHLTQGNVLWNSQIAWELSILETKQVGTSERQAHRFRPIPLLICSHRETLVAHIDELHLDRLQQPHSDHEGTLGSYSSFVTKYYSPDLYESQLVEASKLRGRSSKIWSRKESYEIALGSKPSREQWETYITTEQRAKSSNDLLLNSLYERAILDFANRRWEALLNFTDSSKVVEIHDALVFFWAEYINAVRRQDNPQNEYLIIQRAVRNVPTSGYIWAKYFRTLERIQELLPEGISEIGSVADVYEKALSISELKHEVKEVVQVILAKCSHDKRRMEDENDLALLVATLEEGIKLVRSATKEGDPGLSLEMFLSGIYLSLEPPLGQQAIALWQGTANHYKSNHSAWSKYLETLILEHEYPKARNVFKNLPYKVIDWPELLWQQWSNFEYLYGSIEDIDDCLEKINMFSSKLRKKREEEALQLQQAWFAASTQNSGVDQPQDDTVRPSAPETGDENNLKRKAESPPDQDVQSKRIKQERRRIEEPPKRDRENATIFVNYLPLTADESDLNSLFRDCGKIREIKMDKDEVSLVATIEFMDKESIPAALTKDKKRIRDQEIAVHLAWKSTLYVTNFPENMDDSSIRGLFGKYGDIFDVRWPSKKFKSSRRFCYVQFRSPDAAVSALTLNAHELEPNRALTVYVSDPARKQTRTDASANVREIHVAGLAKSVKEEELRKFFSTFGTIRDIRMPVDGSGNSRGFGFIEFENEATASLALKANNEEFKKRRLAVTLADKRPPKTNDEPASLRKARTIKVKSLPPNTQEALLQQTMEKYGKINKVEVFRKANEALVEFENSHDVGRLLLEGSTVTFGDQQLELMEYDLPATSRASTSSVSMFLPRGGARPRAGLGSKKRDNHIKTKDTGSAPPSDGNSRNQDDFRRMFNS